MTSPVDTTANRRALVQIAEVLELPVPPVTDDGDVLHEWTVRVCAAIRRLRRSQRLAPEHRPGWGQGAS